MTITETSPEEAALLSLTGLLQRGDEAHTDRWFQMLARRLIAHRPTVLAVLQPLESTHRETVLRQQPRAEQDSRDFWLETAHYHQQGLDEANAMLAAMARPVDHDPDGRGMDEDDARISRETADDTANAQAVRL